VSALERLEAGSMMTAFPWVPLTTWRREDAPGQATVWHVEVAAPGAPLPVVRGRGTSPAEALRALVDVVAWYFDWSCRRGGTVHEVYFGRGSEA